MNKNFLRAILIAEKVFEELRYFVRPGVTEKRVADEIRWRLKSYGAHKESFRIIVASGKRSSQIHGFASNKKIKRGDIVMFDFGAIYRNWRSDITRTYVVGKPTARQKKIYEILKRAQAAGLKKVKHGVKCSEVDRAVRETIKRAGYELKHGTGHGVGSKTHQAPRISTKSSHVLKDGDVVTIEPGIYIKNWGGMRLEDMALVTHIGPKILTQVKRSLKL